MYFKALQNDVIVDVYNELQYVKYDEKAKRLYKNRQFDDALRILEEINEKSPGAECVEFTIARIKARKPKTRNESKKMFLKLLQQDNSKYVSNSLLELGRMEISNRNYNKARSYFNKLIKRENEHLAYIGLAKLETKVGNHSKAIEILQTVDKVIDKDSKYHYIVLLELAKASRRNGDLDKAKEYLKIIEEKDNHVEYEWIMLEYSNIEEANNNFVSAITILNKLLNTRIHEIALAELVTIYTNHGCYDLAYRYNNELLKVKNPRSHFNPKQIDIFLKYKLGLEIDIEKEDTYYIKQLYSYSREEAIRHISQHLDEDEKKILHSVYLEDINIEELYEYASRQIQDLEPGEGYVNDKYIIKCDKIVGITIDKQPTDTIKVIVIPNTKDIITMYPIPTINNKLEIENNYTSSKQKVRESQIDKFNRRYAKNS